MNDELHEKALECLKNYKRCENELIEILETIDHEKSYLYHGVSSLFRYCVEKLSLSEGETYRFIQVMRKAKEVPELKLALEAGQLTVSKASRIAPVITKGNEARWIEKASSLPYRDLEREVAEERPLAISKERLKVLTPERSELRVTISAELERKLERAKEVFRTKTMEETLERLVDFALERKDPVKAANRFANRKARSETRQENNQKVEKPAARQVHLDRRIGKFAGRQVGTLTRRPIPAFIRHQVNLRDKGKCTVEGCLETKWVEIHHIWPFSQGGDHSVQNLTTLCSGHHSFMHGLQKSSWKRPAAG